MTDEEIKEKTKKQLVVLEKYIKVLEGSVRVVKHLKEHAVSHQLHKRAIYTVDALRGLNGLIEELQGGRFKALDILGTKKVPIVIEKKLRLVVNNETGGK